MTTQPPRAVVGAATNQSGTASTTTTKVLNTLVQDTKLRFKLAAANDSTAINIILKAGAARNGSALNLDAKVTFTAVNGFASYTDMMNYFKIISSNAIGLQIQTSDTDNFEDNVITVKEQDPTGAVTSIDIPLYDFRTSMGGGTYNDTIVLDSTVFNQIFWPGMEISLATLKPGTSMSFIFTVQGQNKVQELNAIRTKALG